MASTLTRQGIQELLERALASFRHDKCLTSECFLVYVAQLGIDAGAEIHSLLTEMGIDYQHAHSCMGCDPCPPADLFAEYLQARNQ